MAFQSPERIIYNSSRARLQHRDIGFTDKNDLLIPNGFITTKWAPNKIKRQQIRSKLLINKDTKVLGYVGRGDAQKIFLIFLMLSTRFLKSIQILS